MYAVSHPKPTEYEYLFVDGAYLRKCLEKWSTAFFNGDEMELDFTSFASGFQKTFYYDCLPPRKNGNVREWCQDYYSFDYYLKSPEIDPEGPEGGKSRIVRGGSWRSEAFTCRSAYRDLNNPGDIINDLGFRVVLELENK